MFFPHPPFLPCHNFSIRNGIYPMTAFGVPSPQQAQQKTVKSPVVIPLVKSPTPEPAELETRRVCTVTYTEHVLFVGIF